MSVLAINNNTLAYNSANILQGHYSRLATSTERLSTGLRINSAADDAAGLAIRELMRADISALRQGARNVNDAISMLQTTDGALSVIDEKLIRMKELAEQAATGTYDSTQRLMIASEFQAMGDEINRIARATDFNGIKLLDGQTTGAPVVINANGIAVANADIAVFSQAGSDGRDRDATVAPPTITGSNVTPNATDLTANLKDLEALGDGTHTITLTNSNVVTGGANNDYVFRFTTLGNNATFLNSTVSLSYDPANIAANGNGWTIAGLNPSDFIVTQAGNQHTFLFSPTISGWDPFMVSITHKDGTEVTSLDAFSPINWSPATNSDPKFNVSTNSATINSATASGTFDSVNRQLTVSINLGNGNTIQQSFSLASQSSSDLSSLSYSIQVTSKPSTNPGPNPPNPGPDPGPGPVKPPYTGDDPNSPLDPDYVIPDDVVRIHFGSGADSREDFYDIRKHDATLKGLGLDGVNIQTQDAAQNALVSIRDAIVTKDKIRAEYGAMQNRLENTLTNVTVQAENLQAAESRLSDVNVATEMSNFVRNQVLTQSALAMLSQANSMPQMVMSLIR